MNKKIIIYVAVLALVFSCNSDKAKDKDTINLYNSSTKGPNVKQVVESKELKSDDHTDEILQDVGHLLSGSWMYHFDEIDGEREVSWGTVPISNRSYFIIDFLNQNRTFTKGASEGGKLGVDSIISKNLKVESEEENIYRLVFNDILDTFNPKREQEIVIKYYPEEDVLAIVDYYGTKTENPQKMIRISKPIESPLSFVE